MRHDQALESIKSNIEDLKRDQSKSADFIIWRINKLKHELDLELEFDLKFGKETCTVSTQMNRLEELRDEVLSLKD